ncbi:hypothetical protein, partial [Xenorhabdus hominickii]|uniref:hypothetical protein n=1 Tax=Xenorhabdus hominickii TaxID=351679 RepID=UPI00147462A1
HADILNPAVNNGRMEPKLPRHHGFCRDQHNIERVRLRNVAGLLPSKLAVIRHVRRHSPYQAQRLRPV